jgi:predicted DNA-binding protein (UPF0251 family)
MKDLPTIELDHDELEALHLCDSLGLTQQQAGEKMGISRGTIQRLVVSGRKKLVDAITGSQAIAVQGPPEATVNTPATEQPRNN